MATTARRSASTRSSTTKGTRSWPSSWAATPRTRRIARIAGRKRRLRMAPDPTLDLDLAKITDESRRLAASIKPTSGPWDVIVVGSGAAGGMAAFQLATAGVKVLVLEAGRMLDHRREYRTMEWPYASPRRFRLPPDHRPIAVAEYNFLDRPYANNPELAKHKSVTSYAGNTFTRNWVVNEKEHPTTGTP